MTTIVNSPTPTNDSGGFGFLIGVLIIIGFFILILYYGLPAIRNMGPIKVNVPASQPVIPGNIDVNVKQSK